MDAESFDRLAIAVSHPASRRAAVALLAALVLPGGRVQAVSVTCATDGTRCGRTSDLPCCSGVCKRKHRSRKKFCQAAFNQSICTIETGCTGATTFCDAGGTNSCACYVTATGVAFCAQNGAFCDDHCRADADCEQKYQLKGARCLGPGTLCCAGGCVLPCPNPI
ncbi:MAG TPA: hypothetical protein VFU81_09830 [Thermomicrobiales bacterium]|nr:hypothetical protein [Thermomicrobiales bacterium]